MVPIILQDVSDVLEAHQPGLVGETTGAIEAGGRIAFAEGQQTQTDAVGLFRVGPALELPAHPRVHRRSHLPGPAQQALGGPLVLCPMACGHVGRVSGEPGAVLARHRVIMVPILDMVINIDRDRFDGDVAVRVPR